uniref:LigA n=1 Tax=Parastrongyloides trichosuri TaxID=131310 RepID=A0A0N5A5N4_PARTI
MRARLRPGAERVQRAVAPDAVLALEADQHLAVVVAAPAGHAAPSACRPHPVPAARAPDRPNPTRRRSRRRPSASDPTGRAGWRRARRPTAPRPHSARPWPAWPRPASPDRPAGSNRPRAPSRRPRPGRGRSGRRHRGGDSRRALVRGPSRPGADSLGLGLEQLGQLFGHGARQLLDVDDGQGAAIPAGHVVADADGQQFDRAARLDLLDHLTQVLVQIEGRIGRLGRIIDRRAVRDDHHDLPRLGPGQQAVVRPFQRLAVDVFLQQALAHHQAQVLLGPAPRRIGALVDDVAQVVQAARIGRLAGADPGLARLAALPGAGGEAQDLDLDAAPLQRPRQDVGADRRDHDRAPAHRAGVVEHQGHHRVAERAFALHLERQGAGRIGDDAGQARRVQHPFLKVEHPAAVLLRQQAPLQLVGQARHDAAQGRQLGVQQGAQPVQLHRVAQRDRPRPRGRRPGSADGWGGRLRSARGRLPGPRRRVRPARRRGGRGARRRRTDRRPSRPENRPRRRRPVLPARPVQPGLDPAFRRRPRRLPPNRRHRRRRGPGPAPAEGPSAARRRPPDRRRTPPGRPVPPPPWPPARRGPGPAWSWRRRAPARPSSVRAAAGRPPRPPAPAPPRRAGRPTSPAGSVAPNPGCAARPSARARRRPRREPVRRRRTPRRRSCRRDAAARPGLRRDWPVAAPAGRPDRAGWRFRGRRIARRVGQGQHAAGQPRPVRAEAHLQLGLFGQGSRGVRQGAFEGLDGGLCGGHAPHIDHAAPGGRGETPYLAFTRTFIAPFGPALTSKRPVARISSDSLAWP